MAEYISREAAMLEIDAADFVIDANFEGGATLLYCDDVVGRLSAIPAADVRHVRHGRWVDGKCDNCGEHAPYWCLATTFHESNYCPNCGADMREVDDG